MAVWTVHTSFESAMNAADSRSHGLDKTEFASLLRRDFGTLRFVAAAQAGAADADDIVQRAASTALRQLHDFEPGTNFTAWMTAFVRNAARNSRRADRRYRQALGRLRLRQTTAKQSDSVDPMMLAHLRSCLEGLSDSQRECVLLRIVGDRTYEQIAAVTGEPASTARSHVHRGRSRLAACLKHKREGEPDDVQG
ncbi:MAG: RNA polymerase sigma factor [Planctomycetota bacterium]